MYWHSLEPSSEYFNGQVRYAVVDGRQRLEAIFDFLDDEITLSKDNMLLADPVLTLDGLTLSDLREEYGWLYGALMRSTVEVVFIDTTEVDLIEELFSRLNDGVPLSAAEKRNRGAILAPLVRTFTAEQPFFTDRLPFGNNRYRHYDLLAKLMRIEDRGLVNGRIPDLRKVDLDRLFEGLRENEESNPTGTTERIEGLLTKVEANLGRLVEIFENDDRFLSSVGMVTLYYALSHVLDQKGLPALTRENVEHFEGLRETVKGKDDEELDEDETQAIEFARYSQGTTSGSYLTARLNIFLRVEGIVPQS